MYRILNSFKEFCSYSFIHIKDNKSLNVFTKYKIYEILDLLLKMNTRKRKGISFEKYKFVY